MFATVPTESVRPKAQRPNLPELARPEGLVHGRGEPKVRRGVPEDCRGAANAQGALARPAGLEPATPGLEGRCSIQLSYGRVVCMLRER